MTLPFSASYDTTVKVLMTVACLALGAGAIALGSMFAVIGAVSLLLSYAW
jgi:hypothetical protein